MKNIFLLFFAISLIFFLKSCDEEELINLPPTCSITSPANRDIVQGSLVNISVQANDEDGEITKVKLFIDEEEIETFRDFPYTYEWETSQLPLGEYTIETVVIDDDGEEASDKITLEIVEGGVKPIAEFRHFPETSVKGRYVTFTDLSTESPSAWLWDFGDGSTSIDQNPEHIYNEAGLYTITFIVSNDFTSDTIIKEDYLNVIEPHPIAAFYTDKIIVEVGEPIQFFDASLNTPTSWFWEIPWNNTNSSKYTTQNPTHIFNEIGNYWVGVEVENETGKDEYIMPTEIIVTANIEYGEMEDRNGNSYKTIQIGEQVWMAENLRTTRLTNGDYIPLVEEDSVWMKFDKSTIACCFYNNDNKSQYGILYTYKAAIEACPEGWHLPTRDDWNQLREFILLHTPIHQGLKSRFGWYNDDNNRNGTDNFGFNSYPCGYRNFLAKGRFDGAGVSAKFLSNDTISSSIWYASIAYDKEYQTINYPSSSSLGASVRYIKD